MPKHPGPIPLLALGLLLAACTLPVSRTPPPPAVATASFLGPRHAYLGYGSALRVMDITTPTAPALVYELNAGDGQAYVTHVQAAGDRLYVAITQSYTETVFTAYSLRDPARPEKLGEMALPTGYLSAFLVDGRTAYLAASPDLIVLDVADPARMREVGRQATKTGPSLIKAGDTLHTSFGFCGSRSLCDDGYFTISVADPARPVTATQHLPETRWHDFTLRDLEPAGKAWIGALSFEPAADGSATAAFALEVYDVADPANPVRLRRYPAPGPIRAVNDNVVIVMDSQSQRVMAAALSGASELNILISVALPPDGYLAAAEVRDGYAYLIVSRTINVEQTYLQDNALLVLELP